MKTLQEAAIEIMSEGPIPSDLEMDKLLMENVALGNMEIIGKNAEGEKLFRLTEKGRREADAMLMERIEPEKLEDIN